LPITGVGFFCDFLPAQEICKGPQKGTSLDIELLLNISPLAGNGPRASATIAGAILVP
jgi:hypothetical protein